MKFNLSSKLHVNMNLTESLTGIVLKKATKFCKSPLEGVSKMLVVKTSERCQCFRGVFMVHLDHLSYLSQIKLYMNV